MQNVRIAVSGHRCSSRRVNASGESTPGVAVIGLTAARASSGRSSDVIALGFDVQQLQNSETTNQAEISARRFVTLNDQRLGPRGRWIATWTRWPGSLQHMVDHVVAINKTLSRKWQRNQGNGIKDPSRASTFRCQTFRCRRCRLWPSELSKISRIENRITETTPDGRVRWSVLVYSFIRFIR